MFKKGLFLCLILLTFGLVIGCSNSGDNPVMTPMIQSTSTTGNVSISTKTLTCVQHYEQYKDGSCSEYHYVLVDDNGAASHQNHKCDVIGVDLSYCGV